MSSTTVFFDKRQMSQKARAKSLIGIIFAVSIPLPSHGGDTVAPKLDFSTDS